VPLGGMIRVNAQPPGVARANAQAAEMRPNLRLTVPRNDTPRMQTFMAYIAIATRAVIFPPNVFRIWLLQLGTADHYMRSAIRLVVGRERTTLSSAPSFDAMRGDILRAGGAVLSLEPAHATTLNLDAGETLSSGERHFFEWATRI